MLRPLASGGLGSVTVALDTIGNMTAQRLYGPYGNVRYSRGAVVPTAKGYTGQYGDATTGLGNYGGRYYDSLVGQLISADTDNTGGPNRSGYVGGNLETDTDPTGACAGSQ